jgi:2',3'-cyclic-nucleotide 2'-phosphodiesterase (5'-nucleotidase family)
MVGQTPIVQAGSLGAYIGRLDLYFEYKNDTWILQKSDGCLIETDGAVENPDK